jgi:hypothetical protein
MSSLQSDYVVLTTVQGPLEENQMISFLQANGIPVQVQGEIVRKVYGFTLDGLGAAQILVPRDRAAEARDLLERVERGELKIAEDESKGPLPDA